MKAVLLFQIGSAALLLPAHTLGQTFELPLPPLTDPRCATALCALNPEGSCFSQEQVEHRSKYATARLYHNDSGTPLGLENNTIFIAAGAEIVDPLNNLIQIAKELGIIETVKAKLLIRQDEANKHLGVVLGEIARFYQSLDVQISKLLSVEVYEGMPDDIRILMLQRLTELHSASVKIELSKTRGSSKLIYDLYQRFLDPWFQGVTGLNDDERRKMRGLFRELDEIDGIFVESMDEMSTWIGNKAEEAYKSLQARNYSEVSRIIDGARAEIKDFRKESLALVDRMYKLQEEFVDHSRAI